MNILFATSECAPWVKTGGLADVSAALPQALAALGHRVVVFMPAYGVLQSLQSLRSSAVECARLPASGVWPAARLLRVEQPGSFELLLLDCPALYGGAGGPYADPQGHEHSNSALRFAFFGLVAARLAGARTPWPAFTPDVLHCNDWPSGLAPAWLQHTPGPRIPSVMTIHNLAYLGLYAMDVVDTLALPAAWRDVEGAEFWGQFSFLKAGLQFADAITTVSPTYAREIRTEALGCGLHGLLQARAPVLHGILNGIDTAVWNPASDVLLPNTYSAARPGGKALNKAALQQRMGLPAAPQKMLFGVVGRLVAQKGVDLIAASVSWLAANDCQLVVLGSGEPALQARLQDAALAHPACVAVQLGFDEGLAHLIEAGADSFLMPSRYEPCGLNQMYSQAYGTPPVVHGTGGLADSVADFMADPARATGFVMPEASAPALQAAMAQALLLYRQPDAWTALQQRGMAEDFGWQASAARYVALYENLAMKGAPLHAEVRV